MTAVDPLLYAYERELAARDPARRAALGAWATPMPLARFLVRSAAEVVENDLGLRRGLGDPRVVLFDPAVGTGVFLAAALEHAGPAIAPRLLGVDVDPHAVGAARVALEARGARPELVVADALDREPPEVPRGGALVVVGNPPYGCAPGRPRRVDVLMEEWKREVRAEERQLARLSNDYVRFLRLAHDAVLRAKRGVVAFVTDAGWLDGVLFREVRRALFEASDRAWVLRLGGGARGARAAGDENVFSIAQAVAIVILAFGAAKRGRGVRVAELHGTRAEKLAWLDERSISTTRWKASVPSPPAFVLRAPRAEASRARRAYARWPPIHALLGTGDLARDRGVVCGTGVKTRHDDFVVGFDAADAVSRVRRLAHRSESDAALVRALGLCTTKHFDVGAARALAAREGLGRFVRPIAYRPFDARWLVYRREVVCEPKLATMRPLLDDPTALAVAALRRDRSGEASGPLVARGLVAKDFVSSLDDALVWSIPADRASELDWMLAATHAPWYRRTFAEERGLDFARVPRPRDEAARRALAPLGARLRRALLLEVAPTSRVVDFDQPLAAPRYDLDAVALGDLRLPLAREAWDARVGAHAPCRAWLLARRGRRLSPADFDHYARLTAAVGEILAVRRALEALVTDADWRASFAD